MKRYALRSILIVMALTVLVSCGGGGSGSGGAGGGGACVDTSGSSAVTYDGLVTQATISAADANTIFAAVWNGGSPSGPVTIGKPALAKISLSGGMASLTHAIVDRTLSDIPRSTVRSKSMSPMPVSDTVNGSVSGTLTTTGSIDSNTGTGCLAMAYVNFNDGDGYTGDGTIIVNIAGYDMMYDVITDGTLSFNRWTVTSAGADVSLTGSVRIQKDLSSNTETDDISWDGLDNNTGNTFRFQNVVDVTISDNILYPRTGTETESGRIYLSQYGYVDLTTAAPLMYSSPLQNDPDSGGPLILSGAGDSKAAITPISASAFKIEVDSNGDGSYETANDYAWNNPTGNRIDDIAPVANAGPDVSVAVGTLVTLSGSGSSDANGDSLTYSWTMSKPYSSAAVLSDEHALNPTFIADVAGTYTFGLQVYDGTDYSNFTDWITVTASQTAVANAGPDQYQNTGAPRLVTLDGSGSYDSAGRAMTYAWSFKRKPAGSTAALSDPAAVHPTFTADREGKYEVSLQIFYDGYVNSAPDSVVVTVITDRSIAALPFKVIDAEYSKQLERIIMVSGAPSNQLHIYDPVANGDQTIDLSALPTTVSVSPDGMYAAVGHNGMITYADLVTKSVVTTLQWDGDIMDLVLAGNGYVYVLTAWKPFSWIDLSSGASASWNNGAGTKARLHPSGKALYTTLGYAALKFDISSGPAVYLYSSDNIPGLNYNVGNDIWLTEDGTTMITQSGNLFSASSGSTNDMMQPKAYTGFQSQYASDSSAAARVAFIPLAQTYGNVNIDDTELWISDEHYDFLNAIALPYFASGGGYYPGHGKFVFYNSAGTNLFVIMQADTASGLANDFGIVKY